jgi:hypothetical protein
MLGQSHPAYLSQLRTTVDLAKNGADKALIYLTCVSIGVLCAQTVIGIYTITLSWNFHTTVIFRNVLHERHYSEFADFLSYFRFRDLGLDSGTIGICLCCQTVVDSGKTAEKTSLLNALELKSIYYTYLNRVTGIEILSQLEHLVQTLSP